MELLLNLAWLALASASLIAWAIWRRRCNSKSMPGLLRGMLVITCVLALLLPVISITDDLSQSISLAEGTRMQDVLKAPDLRGTHYSTLMLPVITLAALRQPATPAWSFHAEVPITRYQLLRTASIEKRPPPRFV